MRERKTGENTKIQLTQQMIMETESSNLSLGDIKHIFKQEQRETIAEEEEKEEEEEMWEQLSGVKESIDRVEFLNSCQEDYRLDSQKVNKMRQNFDYKTMASCQEKNQDFLEICKKILTPKCQVFLPGYVVVNHSNCGGEENLC